MGSAFHSCELGEVGRHLVIFHVYLTILDGRVNNLFLFVVGVYCVV